MKKKLAAFFLLIFLSQCDQVAERPQRIIHEGGLADSDGGGLTSDGRHQASLSSPPREPDKKQQESAKKKGRTKGFLQQIPPIRDVPGRAIDSVFINRLNYLRSNWIEPDLNEPLSKKYLLSPVEKSHFPSMIALSRESFLKINFDNDILDYTDRFYTNGIRIDLITPTLRNNPARKLMIPYWSAGTNYYGLSLVQNMYTPSTTKTGGILYGDRPYAAYLYLGIFKITNDAAHLFRQTSELDLGIIGPNSYGEWVQRSFHSSVPTNNEPLGWEYQVENDLVLNYSVALEKGIFYRRHIEFIAVATGYAGTLYTNMSGGIQLRTGWFNPYFTNLGISKKQSLIDAGMSRIQFYFFLKGSGKLVGYDATLQGGMFNKTSSYTMPADEISRIVFRSSGGFAFSYNGVRIDLEQYILSPEFDNGLWHKWVHIGLTFSF